MALIPGQGDPGVDVPLTPPPLPDPVVPLPTPTPLVPTPATDDLALTLQSLADRVAALEKTGSFAPGMIAWTAGPDAPPGWLVADGSAFDMNLYAALAIRCPTGFLPNLIDRVAIGAGNLYTLLGTGGAASVTLTGAQSGMPAHMHTVAGATGSTTPGDTGSGGSGTSGSTTPGASGATGGTTGGGSAHSHAASAGQFTEAGSGGSFGWTSGSQTIQSHTNTASESGHTHSMPSHTHTGAAHTHTVPAHVHTSAAHTHTLPDTDTAAAVNATSPISTLSPYVALTPLIHI